MIKLSKELVGKVENDLKNIVNNDKNRIFPKLINYSEFIGLLSRYGMREIANHYGLSIEFGNIFSSDSEYDLEIILSYWLFRYGENMYVDVYDLIDEMESRHVAHLFPKEDVVKACIREKKNIDDKEYNLLSEEDKIRLKKEIEEDESILVVCDHIFLLND